MSSAPMETKTENVKYSGQRGEGQRGVLSSLSSLIFFFSLKNASAGETRSRLGTRYPKFPREQMAKYFFGCCLPFNDR